MVLHVLCCNGTYMQMYMCVNVHGAMKVKTQREKGGNYSRRWPSVRTPPSGVHSLGSHPTPFQYAWQQFQPIQTLKQQWVLYRTLLTSWELEKAW